MVRVLRRLLLGTDDAIARRRRDEPALDRPARVTYCLGEGHSLRPPNRAPCWHNPRRGGRVVVGNGNAVTARDATIGRRCLISGFPN